MRQLRRFRLCSLIILFLFCFQVLSQNYALAQQASRIDMLVDQAAAESVEAINAADSWEDLFELLENAPPGQTPLPSYVIKSTKRLLVAAKAAQQPARSSCRNILGSALGFIGFKKADAKLVASVGTLGLEMAAKDCVQKVGLPDFDSVMPTLVWNGSQLHAGEKTLNYAKGKGRFDVQGTYAKIELRDWKKSMRSESTFNKQVAQLEKDVKREKLGWLQNLLLPSAYADPILGFLFVALVVVLMSLLVVGFINNGAWQNHMWGYYTTLIEEIQTSLSAQREGKAYESRRYLERLIAHMEQERSLTPFGELLPRDLLIPRNSRSGSEPYQPCSGPPCAKPITLDFLRQWDRACWRFVKLSAGDVEVVSSFLDDYIYKYFIKENSRGLRSDRLEALHHILQLVRDENESDSIQEKVRAIKNRLSSMPASW